MPTTETDIANSALLKLGSRMITSLLDIDSDQARIMNHLYPQVRDAVLRIHPWNCAKERVQLSELADSPEFGYAHQYQLPSDSLRVLTVNEIPVTRIDLSDTADTVIFVGPVRYKIEGRILLTDDTSVKITYIKRVTDPSQYDSLLFDLIATRLAAEAAYAITRKLDVERQKWEEYRGKLPDSRTVDGMEEYHEADEGDEINFARR